jgi:hypothetical protein
LFGKDWIIASTICGVVAMGYVFILECSFRFTQPAFKDQLVDCLIANYQPVGKVKLREFC